MTPRTKEETAITIIPPAAALTPAALRRQVVRNNADAIDRGGVGPAGNARLTGMTATALLVLLALEGLTLIALGPLLTAHVFLGMLLIPPVALKLASTGYRFLRYYIASPDYRREGPPALLMRLLGPFLIAATAALFGSGVAMLVAGPSSAWIVTVHKASFIVWVGVTAIHVLGHVLHLPGLASADFRASRSRREGAALRQIAVAGALVAGLVLALVTVHYVTPWHTIVG